MNKVGRIEAIALLIAVVTNNVIFNIPSIILNLSGTGAWLSIIYLGIISLVFVIVLAKLFEPFIQSDILDVSEFLGGKFLKFIIGILYIVFLAGFTGGCIRYFSNALHLIYFNDTPLLFLLMLFVIPIAISNKYGLRAISGTNLIFIPISVISIIVLFLAASKDFVWQRLFPIFGYSPQNLFINQLPTVSAFNVVLYLYFAKPFLKDEKHFKTISIFCVILCGIYLLASMLSLLMTFSFITQANETLSLYLLSRLVGFGNFLQRLDAIFIFVWILEMLCFFSFNTFLIINIIKKLLNLKYPTELCYSISASLIGICLSFSNTASLKNFNKGFVRIYHTSLVFVVSFIIVLLAYIKKKKKRKGAVR